MLRTTQALSALLAPAGVQNTAEHKKLFAAKLRTAAAAPAHATR